MARLVVASNRVGSTLKANEGGLATAVLAAVARREVTWFGWSGELTDGVPGATRTDLEGSLTRLLVDLNRSDYEGYYLGFANRVLWPLFHYRVNLSEFSREDWAAYSRVNAFYAERLAKALNPDDVVWVHDYQMLPLGAELRRLGVNNRIGFFLHIPFPGPEMLLTVPVHETLVRGLLAYDLVGFQTENDRQALVDYVKREAGGWASSDGRLHAFGRSTRTGSFPISIDTRTVAARAARAAGSGIGGRLRSSLGDRRLVIGVDRLDYTKGLIRRFAAVERLFESRPQHRRTTVVMQIASPTREDIPEYQQIRAELDGAIGRINGRFGEPDHLPVRYINRHFRQETLFGFFRASRVALVTPLRDGMNLVAKEFVASQDPADPGVVVLSRFAGAARELDAALIVNPFDVDEVADALDRGLEMPLDERQHRQRTMMQWLLRHDVHRWMERYLEALERDAAVPREASAGQVIDLAMSRVQ